MVRTAAKVDWTVVATEVEALQLEYSWIKEFDPRFNVRYRDDKSYPYLAVTMGEDFPAGHGHARRQAARGSLFRALLARVGNSRNGRCAAAGVPGPHLLGRGVQAGRADRAALPARLHRQVLGAVRGPGQRGRAPAARRGILRLHGRADRPVHPPPGSRDARGRPGRGVRAGRAAARRHQGAAAGPGEADRGPGRRHRLRRHRAHAGPAGSGGPGLLRAGRPGPRAARLGGGQGRGCDHRRAGRAIPGPGLQRRRGGRPGAGHADPGRLRGGAGAQDHGAEGKRPPGHPVRGHSARGAGPGTPAGRAGGRGMAGGTPRRPGPAPGARCAGPRRRCWRP